MKDIIVSKFGGSSLADSKQFMKVKNIVMSDPCRKYIVPSAPGKRDGKDHKVTDLLYMCHQLASSGIGFEDVYGILEKRYEDICRELDVACNIQEILIEIKNKIREGSSRAYVASRGEYINGIILSKYFGFEFIDAAEVVIFDGENQFDFEKTKEKIRNRLEHVAYGVIPGFYGSNEAGDIVTFSRGGSDITGAIIASAMECRLYENWTDVSGFLRADPKIVNRPRTIEKITYRELRELSYMGAPVLHEEAVFPVKQVGIPIHIRNTNAVEDLGTMIIKEEDTVVDCSETITGISGKKDFTVLFIEKTSMVTEKGFLRKLMSVIESNGISIEHMHSNVDSISLVISSSEINSKLDKVLEEIRIYCRPDSIFSHPNMALVAVVGRSMVHTKGVSAKIFAALANAGIDNRMITQGSNELNIIIGVENHDFNQAIAVIYEAFEN